MCAAAGAAVNVNDTTTTKLGWRGLEARGVGSRVDATGCFLKGIGVGEAAAACCASAAAGGANVRTSVRMPAGVLVLLGAAATLNDTHVVDSAAFGVRIVGGRTSGMLSATACCVRGCSLESLRVGAGGGATLRCCILTGGAAGLHAGGSGCVLTATSCTISDAGTDGIRVAYGAHATLTACDVKGSAAGDGALVSAGAKLVLNKSTVRCGLVLVRVEMQQHSPWTSAQCGLSGIAAYRRCPSSMVHHPAQIVGFGVSSTQTSAVFAHEMDAASHGALLLQVANAKQGHGICLSGANTCLVATEVIVSGSGKHGLRVADGASATLVRTTLDANALCGLALETEGCALAEHCQLLRNGMDAASLVFGAPLNAPRPASSSPCQPVHAAASEIVCAPALLCVCVVCKGRTMQSALCAVAWAKTFRVVWVLSLKVCAG